MTDKIIVVVSPVDIRQTIYVYKDGDLLFKISVPSCELKTSIPTLIEKHQVFNLTFAGPQTYAKKFANDIQEHAIKTYGANKVNISYS